jgi:tol-pal system protein YbgF
MKNSRFVITLVAISFAFSGCLKTRAQLRGDSPDDDNSGGASKPQPAQVTDVQPQGQYAMDELRAEVTRLDGRVEDMERQQKDGASAATSANKDDLKKLETRIVELEQAQANMLEALKKMQDSPAASANPEETFEKGKSFFDAGNYDDAINSLDAYLKSPKAQRTQEATFLRAESYFAQKQYKKAIVDYSKFPEKFTTSKHMPQALYKIGASFEALGMKDDAKGFYQELLEKFPKSAEAKRVKSKVK